MDKQLENHAYAVYDKTDNQVLVVPEALSRQYPSLFLVLSSCTMPNTFPCRVPHSSSLVSKFVSYFFQ